MTVVELLELVKKMTRSLEDVDVEREATRRGGKISIVRKGKTKQEV